MRHRKETIQQDAVESASLSTVDLIDSFPFSINFFYWLSSGNFSEHPIHTSIAEGIHTKLWQYRIDDLLVYTARGEYALEKFSPKSVSFINEREKSFPFLIPESVKFKKKILTKVITDPYYMVISQIYENGESHAMLWEFFELPTILQIYEKKEDPLRYWKMDRRE